MDDADVPTCDRPLAVGEHRFWVEAPGILVVVYRGPVSAVHIKTFVDTIIRYSEGLVALVGDAKEMGRFSSDARRAMTDFDPSTFKQDSTELRLYTTGASVITRAVMTLGATAARLVSKRRSKLFFPATFEEGIALARAYAEEVAANRSAAGERGDA